jgi:hypothetical protein
MYGVGGKKDRVNKPAGRVDMAWLWPAMAGWLAGLDGMIDYLILFFCIMESG